jgi:hypothetical protein
MLEVRPVEVLGTIAFAATPGGVWDLLLSCPFDVEGAVLRTTPVEGRSRRAPLWLAPEATVA